MFADHAELKGLARQVGGFPAITHTQARAAGRRVESGRAEAVNELYKATDRLSEYLSDGRETQWNKIERTVVDTGHQCLNVVTDASGMLSDKSNMKLKKGNANSTI